MPLPTGYRQGIITSITVFLSFCLAFMRYWGFDAGGEWGWSSVLTLVLMIISLGVQIYSLWRALNLRDEDEKEYRKTVKWFMTGVFLLVLSFILSMYIVI